jgi:hypothetical protein
VGGDCEFKALKPIVFIGTIGHGGIFTKEALEEIASYQDVCTPFSSPLPLNLNIPKTVANLFWICALVLIATLLESTNKSDNVMHPFH